MRNIFIAYMATGNFEQMVHYQDTVKNRVNQDRITPYIDRNLQSKLRSFWGDKPITIWSSRDSDANRARFEGMKPGDDMLIVEGSTIKLLGKLFATIISPALSRELLFIVAPTAKKNRVFEQLRRPSFKKLGLDREVLTTSSGFSPALPIPLPASH